LSTGEAFIEEGEDSETMFIVESGDIEVEVESVGVVRTYQPGQFFGEKAVLGSGTRSATVRCMSTCEEATCFAFGRDAVLDFSGAIKLEVATQEQVCVVSLSTVHPPLFPALKQ
jgi:CRP-like cAMP-binding protein